MSPRKHDWTGLNSLNPDQGMIKFKTPFRHNPNPEWIEIDVYKHKDRYVELVTLLKQHDISCNLELDQKNLHEKHWQVRLSKEADITKFHVLLGELMAWGPTPNVHGEDFYPKAGVQLHKEIFGLLPTSVNISVREKPVLNLKIQEKFAEHFSKDEMARMAENWQKYSNEVGGSQSRY